MFKTSKSSLGGGAVDSLLEEEVGGGDVSMFSAADTTLPLVRLALSLSPSLPTSSVSPRSRR